MLTELTQLDEAITEAEFKRLRKRYITLKEDDLPGQVPSAGLPLSVLILFGVLGLGVILVGILMPGVEAVFNRVGIVFSGFSLLFPVAAYVKRKRAESYRHIYLWLTLTPKLSTLTRVNFLLDVLLTSAEREVADTLIADGFTGTVIELVETSRALS